MTFVRRFTQAFITCCFFLAISSPFSEAALHALTVAIPVALVGVGAAYGQRVVSCRCHVDVMHGRFTAGCPVHSKADKHWYVTDGGDWRRREIPGESQVMRLVIRNCEDYVNLERDIEWLEKACDSDIERFGPKSEGAKWSTGVKGLGKKIDDTPDYLALKKAGRPDESPFRSPPMEAILKV